MSNFLLRPRVCWITLITVLLSLMGCVPVSYTGWTGPQQRRIGTLRLLGDGLVHLNGRQATNGKTVYERDQLSTGAGSGALVEFAGGSIQLDENTDPWFEWKKNEHGQNCLYFHIEFGQVWVVNDRRLVCFDSPHSGGGIYSIVNIRVDRLATAITVFEGQVRVTRPASQLLRAREDVAVERNRIGPVRVLADRELQEVSRWRDNYPLDYRRRDDYGGEERPSGRDRRDRSAQRCDTYARTAIAQNEQNDRRGCGFHGARWSSDYNHHYQWCLAVPEQAARSETQEREIALGTQCREPDSTGDARRCDTYARTAIAQNEQNDRKGCGFHGARWSSDYNHHYQWCLAVPEQAARSETQEREDALRTQCHTIF